ncbi:uncharacterized protein LOC122962927 [Acropora millepora]|uniref:uncharacterized protein LOC122962927 n=1 Tax=Acropora millepora TaxID=45264 RepID=UPI001CF53A69|nr:uncharacterized protein LOC122962927 [Acropora millepora]
MGNPLLDFCKQKLQVVEEVSVFKTVAKAVKLAKAIYLGPNDLTDKDEMYSLLQLNTNYLSKDNEEISLPAVTSEGKTTLNELKGNALFTWKTSKLGPHKQNQQLRNCPPTKKFKSNKTFVSKLKSKDDEDATEENKFIDPVPSDNVKGHDGGTLSIGQWVAVAYNEGFYIGQVTSINFRLLDSAEEVDVNFLTKSKAGETYKWPKRKDTDNVSTTYIFCSTPIVQKVGTNFVLSNKNNIAKQYDSYKKTYMIQ